MQNCVTLLHRSFIIVKGSDKLSFLQGLVTNDMRGVGAHSMVFTLLLSPQGRYQYDLFVFERGDDWWIDCPKDRVIPLIKRLTLFKLRADVILEVGPPDACVQAIWGDSIEKEGVYSDPRHPEMGARRLSFQRNETEDTASLEDYEYHRIGLGIPDGDQDALIDKGIPLECGYDKLHAIDWEKGCYMGQELTARTHYRGLIRKKLMPIYFSHPVALPPLSFIYQGEQEIGSLRSAVWDRAMALIRLEALENPAPWMCGGQEVKPI